MPAAGSPGQAPMLLRTSFVQQGGEPGRPAAPNGWSSPAGTCRAAFSCRLALWQFRFCAAQPALHEMRQKCRSFLQRLRKCTAHPPTPHPSRRTAAPPSPQGEGLQAPLWLHRCSDALGEAVYTPPHTPGALSRAASSRRDRPPTSVSKQSAHTVSPPRTHGHRYASSHDGSGAKHTSHRRIRVPPFRLQNYYALG